MRACHARQIRAGISIARMAPADVAWILTFNHPPRLTIRAYRLESINVLRRMLRSPHIISTAELRQRCGR